MDHNCQTTTIWITFQASRLITTASHSPFVIGYVGGNSWTLC